MTSSCRRSTRRSAPVGGELSAVAGRKPTEAVVDSDVAGSASVELARFVPSARSLLVGFALVALAIGAYAVARATPLFAIRTIEVVGADGRTAAGVRSALSPFEGRSLVGLELGALDHRVARLPDVVGATYDRAFPNTLRVFVRPERPVAVLRRGAEAWLISERGRAIARFGPGRRLRLPRIWVTQTVPVSLGERVADRDVLRAVATVSLAGIGALGSGVASVEIRDGEITLRLRDRTEIRLGGAQALPLKLAVAAEVVARIAPASPARERLYVDLGVPARPVVGLSTSR